jgi:hypothetical protein
MRSRAEVSASPHACRVDFLAHLGCGYNGAHQQEQEGTPSLVLQIAAGIVLAVAILAGGAAGWRGFKERQQSEQRDETVTRVIDTAKRY